MSSKSSDRRYPSRRMRLTRTGAAGDGKKKGERWRRARGQLTQKPGSRCDHASFAELRREVNGHGSRPSRRERRHRQDSDGATSPGSDRDEGVTVRRSLKRKTARAAVNKMKLLEASEEEEDEDEKKPRRSSSRLQHTARVSKRTAVIQSSSDSDGDAGGRPTPRKSYGEIWDWRVYAVLFAQLLRKARSCALNPRMKMETRVPPHLWPNRTEKRRGSRANPGEPPGRKEVVRIHRNRLNVFTALFNIF